MWALTRCACASFGATERLIHELCDRRGRWPGEFWALPSQERADVIAFELQRREQLANTVERAMDHARKDGVVSADILTAHLLMALVRQG
jgi:hypothetical protein